MTTPISGSFFVAPSKRGGSPRPERRKRRVPPGSHLGRFTWSLLIALVRLATLAAGILAAWLVIVAGLMVWFLPAQIFGWVWAALFILPGMAFGLLAVNAAELVIRVGNRLGNRLLYRRAEVTQPPPAEA